MGKFDGYLFSKLQHIWTESQGPIYILQQWDYWEIPVVKKTEPWEEDPTLHKFLAKKVRIEGTYRQDGIHYDKINIIPDMVKEKVEEELEIDLKLDPEVLWVDKMPGDRPPQSMKLTLLVRWPYWSIWHGVCPTTQIYDFFIMYEDKIIWHWADGKMFLQVLTPVTIPGDGPVEYPETWHFHPDEITFEGTHTARAIFIASGQEVTKDFEVKFAYKS